MIPLEKLLFFLLTIGILIAVHEYGHYRVARACGVRVLRFSFGFGRVLWRRQASPEATEFVLSAIPFGGYVRMLDERDGPVEPALRAAAFNRLPLAQRALVMAAGPAANLALAVLLYAGAQWIGIEEPVAVLGSPARGSLMEAAGVRAGDRVLATGELPAAGEGADPAWREVRAYSDVRWALTQAVLDHRPLQLRVRSAGAAGDHVLALPIDTLASRDLDGGTLARLGLGGPFSRAVINEVRADGPAARAGLRAGDAVIAIDGQPIADAPALFERIRGSGRDGRAPAAMQWELKRQGLALTLSVQPRLAQDDAGNPIGRIDAGIAAPYETVLVRDDLLPALGIGLARTGDNIALTMRMLGRMIVGEASLKNLSGPLSIADAAGRSAHEGVSYYLAFLAMVSVSLGVLNLLPLPMLDGGHLIYYLFEGATGRPVSDLWLAWLQRGGVLILLLLMSLALSNDVVRLLGR